MDGWVIVGTKLDSKQLDKDLKSAERKLQQYEKEAERLTKTKAKAEIDLRSYEEEKRLIKEINAESLQYAQNEQEIANNMQIEKNQLEELNQKYSKQLATLEEVNNKIKENAKNQSLMKTEIQQTSEKLEKSKMKENIEDIGKSTSKTITKVGKWALAIFGVRSAYMFVRQSASTLAQYNEKIASDLEYISFSLASMLQPVIEGTIQIVYKLLTYINMIANSLFGVNLFANATHEAFNKSNKEAKELKKTLAGFDEMNVLSTTSAGGGTTTTAPSFDLSGSLNSEETEKAKNFWNDIFTFWEEDWSKWFTEVEGNWNAFFTGLGGTLKGFYDVFKGIFDLIAGIVKIFIGIFKGDLQTLEEGWKQTCEGLKNVFLGLMEILVGIILVGLGTIKGIFLDLVTFVYNNIVQPIAKAVGGAWSEMTKGARGAWNGIKSVFSGVAKFFGDTFESAWTRVKKVFSTGGKIFDGIKDGIVEAFKKIVNTLISGINKVISIPFNAINSTLNKIRSTDILGVKPFKGLWEKNPISIPKIPKLAVGGIVNMPGRGIYHGGAEIGERGAEGVIPLTNSQMMAQLGEAIGKYININATVPVYVGNRQIAREIKKINADNDFAFNE